LDNKIREEDALNPASLTDFELGVLIERTRSIYSRMRELELAKYGFTPEQAAVLHVLKSQGGSAANDEIAKIIVRQYHSVASIVSRMEKLGLVKKEKSKGEKKFIISITEKGSDKYSKVPMNSITMVFETLSPEEKRQLTALLKKVMSQGRRLLGLDYKLPFL
jgi:DNA-binding MarR family transcriptional regulator